MSAKHHLFSIALLSTIALFDVIHGQNYCNVASCGNNRGQHTLCRFHPNWVSQRCTQRGDYGGGLSQGEKNAILNRHNQLRQWLAQGREGRGAPGPQPAATNMGYMVWDNELANIAQTWANQCDWGHDTCRNSNRFPVGQNIAQSGTTGDPRGINVVPLVDMWYNEVKDFDRNDVRQFKSLSSRTGKVIGHYTQFVWANSNRLGCGARNYNDGKWKWKYLVCNYGPTGNWIGQPVYNPR